MNKNKIIGDLSSLISELSNKGFIRAASIITNILYNLVSEKENNTSNYNPEIADLAKNIVGLTDNTVQNMNQGIIWESVPSQYISTG